MSSLPDEIIMEIVTRLPINSLYRFKCVSKPWFKFISERESPLNHLLMAGEKYLVKTPLFSVEGASFDETVEIENPKKNPSDDAAVVLGCCDGIVCLGLTFAVCLLNPSTKEYKIVHGFDIDEFDRVMHYGYTSFYNKHDVFGFGYDQSNECYKLVQFGWCDQAIVYSINKDTCSKISVEIGPYYLSDKDQLGIYIGGAIQWIAQRNCDSTVVIICFDMKENVFREMLPPVAGRINTLGVLEETLCFSCRFRGGIIDIWVMQTYNKSDSWYKLFSIGKNVPPFTNRPTRVLCFAQSGKVVMRHRKKLIVYDPKDETFTYMNYKGVCWNYVKTIVPYVAIPVPLKSGTYLRSVRTSEKVTKKRRREV